MADLIVPIAQHSVFAVTLCGVDLTCTLACAIWANRAKAEPDFAPALHEMLFRWVVYWVLAIFLLVL